MMDHTLIDICLISLAGLLIGAAKAGLKGMSIVVVALLVHVYGAKAQTGILLPILIVGDILAVIYYRRHARWEYLVKLLPAMILGIIIAALVGDSLDEHSFKRWLGVIVIISVVIMFWWELRGKANYPSGWWFAGSAGVSAGFTTMIGNLAGAFANMFFLATRLPKQEIIGTSAWLFLIVNLIKLPIHIFSWETVNASSIWESMSLIPGVILGFWVGLYLVRLINEKYYRYFLYVATAIGAIAIYL